MKEFRNLITIFKKSFNFDKEIIKKINAYLFNKIIYFEKNPNEIENDIITIEKKISKMIIDRDYVIITFTKIMNNEF
jgi:hypothetical protein